MILAPTMPFCLDIFRMSTTVSAASSARSTRGLARRPVNNFERAKSFNTAFPQKNCRRLRLRKDPHSRLKVSSFLISKSIGVPLRRLCPMRGAVFFNTCVSSRDSDLPGCRNKVLHDSPALARLVETLTQRTALRDV